MSDLITVDVLFQTEDFILVTTCEMPYTPDQREVEKAALAKIALTYGKEWADTLKANALRVSIEVVSSNAPQEPSDTANGGEA